MKQLAIMISAWTTGIVVWLIISGNVNPGAGLIIGLLILGLLAITEKRHEDLPNRS